MNQNERELVVESQSSENQPLQPMNQIIQRPVYSEKSESCLVDASELAHSYKCALVFVMSTMKTIRISISWTQLMELLK